MAEEKDRQSTITMPTAPISAERLFEIESFLKSIVKSEIRKSVPLAIDESFQKFRFDEEVSGLIHLLAARSNDAKDQVLRKALTLYGLALDAREKGNKLAILGPDDEILHDVTGFEPIPD